MAPAKRGRPPVLGLYRRVVLTLVLLRSNLSQTMLADWFGISQPTVSRVYRAMLPLVEQVTCLHRPPLPEVLAGRVVVADGTIVPVGNRRTDRVTHDRAAFGAVGFDQLLARTPTLGDLGYQAGHAANAQATPTTTRPPRSGTAVSPACGSRSNARSLTGRTGKSPPPATADDSPNSPTSSASSPPSSTTASAGDPTSE
ncbi:helix-turn-helix domain-containing protein [Actinophytocola sp. KF-1]